jgi:hypothetical protein
MEVGGLPSLTGNSLINWMQSGQAAKARLLRHKTLVEKLLKYALHL